MLNRGVVIVRPKQPYLDWAAGLDDSGIVPDPNDEQTVYLIPSYGDDEEGGRSSKECIPRSSRTNSMGGTRTRRHGHKAETSRCSRRGSRSSCTRWSRISATTRLLMRMMKPRMMKPNPPAGGTTLDDRLCQFCANTMSFQMAPCAR